MSHLNPSGSATGNPRNKTILGPGKSLMDWVRLTNSGKDLTGTGGVLLNVSQEELARHNKETDAWIAIGGIVYNVTEYLSFHPGGEAELMRGVGTDATKLFNAVHSWVNYQSLLKKCIVGRLKSISTSTISTVVTSDSPKNTAKDSISGLNSNLIVTKISEVPSVSDEKFQFISKTDWFQQLASVFLIVYFKGNSINLVHPVQVSASLNSARSLAISVENETVEYELEDDVRWPCDIKVDQSRAEVRLTKKNPQLWSINGKTMIGCTAVGDFCGMKVVYVSSVTHDTKLIGLQYEKELIHHIHVGHHVFLRTTNAGNKITKSYTPISLLVSNSDINSNASVYFLIKEYKTGQLSHILCSLKIGDTVEMSKPLGTFNLNFLEKRSNLVFFAAGTGFTPFTSLITWALNNTGSSIKLIFFNKTENDIIWRRELDILSSQNSRFQVTHVLSQPSPAWTGYKGLVSDDLMKSILTHSIEETYVCICGPIKFNELCIKLLKEFGCCERDFFCFQG